MSLWQFVTENDILIFRKMFFFNFGHEKHWVRIRIRIRIDLKCLIEFNTDPKHCFQVWLMTAH